MKKRGYFFTLDALIAVGILIAGMVWILSITSYEPPKTQTAFLAEDVINTIANVKIYELNNRYVDRLIGDKSITEKGNTVLEQVGEFYYRKEFGLAFSLVENITSGQIPPQQGFELLVENKSIYLSKEFSNSTPLLISKKLIVSGIINKTVMFGPYEAEARVWQS